MNERILLTGATGFLGSNLLRALLGRGYRVSILTRCSSDPFRIRDILGDVRRLNVENVHPTRIFQEERYDVILHCATNYGRKDVDPITLIEANLTLPLMLLHQGARSGVSCFVNTDTILDKRISHYSLSKCQFKDWLKMYSGSISCINVAIEHFFGPRDDETKFTSFIIGSMVRRVARIELTKGEQKRDFIYIDDVVEAFVRIIAHRVCNHQSRGYSRYEVGTGKSVKVSEFVRLVKRIANNRTTLLDFGALPYRENEVMDSKVDIEALTALGWVPQVSLEEGIHRTIACEREAGRT